MRDPSCLRLRLVVRRHALPEVRVVFVVQLLNDPTIANLLEQVNEIIPLESNDWGLEDYTVQLSDFDGHAFDCLHFQQVSVVLKNDEEVHIRPLDTGDRRKRRLSGRDQISADGKHLIDGVAFGRPRLKTPRDRPPVDIPPLKRRRITYDEEESDHEEPQLLLTERGEATPRDRSRGPFRLRARFADTDGDRLESDEEERDDEFVDEDADGNTDEDEGEFDMDDLPESDIEDELRDLQEENDQALQDQTPVGSRESNKEAEQERLALNLETLDKLSALRAAFPTAPVGDCERALEIRRGNLRMAYRKLMMTRQYEPAMSLRDTLSVYDNTPRPRLDVPTAEAVTEEHNAAEPEGSDEDSDSEAESVASIVKHYDQHGFPGGSFMDGTASAQMVEAMRKSGLPVKAPVHTKFDEGPNTCRDQQSPVSSGPGSDSESERDSGPEVASSKPPGSSKLSKQPSPPSDSESENESSSESESDSDSDGDGSSLSGSNDSDDEGDIGDSDDSDSDSDSDSDGTGREGSDAVSSADENSDRGSHSSVANSTSAGESDASESDTSSSDEDSSSDSDDGASKPPAVQKTTTPRAPAPPPSREVIKLVPPGQGKTATQRRNARRRAALKALKAAVRGETFPKPAESALPKARSTDFSASIAAKKAELLQNLKLLGVPAQDAEDGAIKNPSGESTAPAASAVNSLVQEIHTPNQEPVDAGSTTADSQQKAKLDLHSALMNGIDLLANAGLLDSVNNDGQQPRDGVAGERDPEAWRDKIIYRGVECCEEGIELSEPPFPFVQRWDPQQQYFPKGNQRGGRSKRKQRNQADYLDEESQYSAKRRKYGGDAMEYNGDDYGEESYAYQDNGTGYEDTTLNYDDEPQEVPQQTEQAPSQEAEEKDEEEEEEDDLPTIPADLTTLPLLRTGEAKTGMVLTWKQWLLSKATNWQPLVSDITGIVVDVDDGALGIRLAKRDQNLDRNEKVYDDDGNRVYDKFELPDLDSEGEEGEEAEDPGYRTLDIADMIEPRILRPAPQAEGTEQEEIEASERVSVTLGREEVENGLFVSQEINMDSQLKDGDQSTVPETVVSQDLVVDVSVSEERRNEISLLINDAGFRKDVDPSVRKSPSLDLSSPSRQLEEMTHHAPIPTSEVSEAQSLIRSVTATQSISNDIDSQPILLEPFLGFSDATEAPEEGRVAYPKLDLPPSDTGSSHGGRQVDPDYSIELGNNSLHGLEGDRVASSAPHDSDDEFNGSESDSDDPFPTLDELWQSASTNRSMPSSNSAAVLSAVKARKPDDVRDLEYEEAMRRLDNDDGSEDDDEDQREQLSKRAQQLVDKPIEKPSPMKPAQQNGVTKRFTNTHIKVEHASPSPSTLSSRASQTQSITSPFVVPQGSQVVSLLSSSPEPELVENYAEDDIDETYQDPDMPTGPGWRKKEMTRKRREISMPASSAVREAPKRFASTQPSRQGMEPRDKRLVNGSAAALDGIARAKHKVLAKKPAGV